MKWPDPPAIFGFCVVIFCLTGCSTTANHIGPDSFRLKVGQKYIIKREAILLANRGAMDSIENPNHSMADYRPYKDYDPYCTKPIGVLPTGTVIEVKEIRLFKHNQFRVMGEIMTGKYKRQPVRAYDILKGYTVGGWPPTGKVVMNNLCGGRSFEPAELARNLSEKVE